MSNRYCWCWPLKVHVVITWCAWSEEYCMFWMNELNTNTITKKMPGCVCTLTVLTVGVVQNRCQHSKHKLASWVRSSSGCQQKYSLVLTSVCVYWCPTLSMNFKLFIMSGSPRRLYGNCWRRTIIHPYGYSLSYSDESTRLPYTLMTH